MFKPLRFSNTKRYFPEFIAPLAPVNEPLRRSTAPTREAASKRILVTRTGANGDILMGTPLLAALREHWPDAHLTWMVERKEREAIDASPYIDEVLLWDTMFWKKMTRRGLYPLWAFHMMRLYQRLRQRQFDIYISFQPEDWPVFTRMTGATERIGIFDTFREYHGHTKTSGRARHYTTAYPFETHPPHRVDQYLLPLQALNVPPPQSKRLSIGYTEEDAQTVRDYQRETLHNQPFVIIAPLTGWPSRIWPMERFAAVADEIARRTGHQIVLVSGPAPKERAALEQVAEQMTGAKPHLACGTFGFRALSALIENAELVLSGDTGPMHVASGVGTPYVALFGPSPVPRFAPLVGKGLPLMHPVECGPCHQFTCHNTGDDYQKCLKLITPEEVVSAALRYLLPSSPAPPAAPRPQAEAAHV